MRRRRRPRLADFYSGGGGCSVGYDRAGFEVTGIDIEPHPAYPFEFVHADARELMVDPTFLAQFDVVVGSPPCQELTRARHLREAQGGTVKEHGLNLIPETRAAFQASGKPYVIENVEDARPHLLSPIMLCGSTFGLALWSLTDEERQELRWWLPFNLQLLCDSCHAAKTKVEAGQRAALRRTLRV